MLSLMNRVQFRCAPGVGCVHLSGLLVQAVNTTLSAMAGGITCYTIQRLREREYDIIRFGNAVLSTLHRLLPPLPAFGSVRPLRSHAHQVGPLKPLCFSVRKVALSQSPVLAPAWSLGQPVS